MTKAVSSETLDAVTEVLPEELPLIGIVAVCGVIVTQYANSEEDAGNMVMELAAQINRYYRTMSTEQCDCASCKAKRKELN